MAVKFSDNSVGKYSVLSIYGDMLSDFRNGVKINDYISELINKGSRHIIFDVSRLQTPSSDLVSIIIETHKKLRKDGGSVSIVYRSPGEHDIFNTCGLYNFARHYQSLEVFRREVLWPNRKL